jgi:small subunit ribosomal protein S6
MKHYEILFLVHPDQGEQITDIINLYRNIVTDSSGKIHRCENWGRKQLAYPIAKTIHKAHYVLMNIECSYSVMQKIEANFRFSDAVLRSLVTSCKKAVTIPSTMVSTETRDRKQKHDPSAIDYKCTNELQNYIMETGRIIPSRVSNISAKDQRRITNAIKRARFIALLPYCDRHEYS